MYSNYNAPFSLKTPEQKSLEKKRMDFYFINNIISIIGFIITFILSRTFFQTNTQLSFYIGIILFAFLVFIFPIALIITSFKFEIKLLLVMLRLKRWTYLILTIFTGIAIFFFYFREYRPFLEDKKSLIEISKA